MESCCGSLTIEWPRKSGDGMSNKLGETEHRLDIIFSFELKSSICFSQDDVHEFVIINSMLNLLIDCYIVFHNQSIYITTDSCKM